MTKEGEYVPPPKDNQKATYATMIFVRADIVTHTARFLAKAACIATRYCCVRRQTSPAPSQRELQVPPPLQPPSTPHLNQLPAIHAPPPGNA